MTTWRQNVSAAIANALDQCRRKVGERPIAMVALDCHPWNGILLIAILTEAEVEAEPPLADPATMAGWDYYNAAGSSAAQKVIDKLAQSMKHDCAKTTDPTRVAKDYLVKCGEALCSPRIGKALRAYRLARGFRLSVAHPDSGKEFCTKAMQQAVVPAAAYQAFGRYRKSKTANPAVMKPKPIARKTDAPLATTKRTARKKPS